MASSSKVEDISATMPSVSPCDAGSPIATSAADIIKNKTATTNKSQHTEGPIESCSSFDKPSVPATAPRKPSRKVSVFSHNGFQQLDQLDQASLKQHNVQNLQQRQQQHHETHTTNNDSTKESSSNTSAGNASSNKNVQRPHRNDTLGSTGSSRASSCDEPTIIQQHNGACGDTSMKPPPPVVRIDGDSTLSSIEADKQSNKSASSSSLESLSDSDTNEQTKPKSSEMTVPPFESIKSQLKRNSLLDPAKMREHIDQLISRNEAIVDNCNLVSIRSYNNNNNNNNNNQPTAAVGQGRQTTTSMFGSVELPKQTLAGRPEVKRTKRWSTTAIGSKPVGVFPYMQRADVSTTTSKHQVQCVQVPKASGTERKRSFNISTPTSLEPIPQDQQLSLNIHKYTDNHIQQRYMIDHQHDVLRQKMFQQQQNSSLDYAILQLQQQQQQQQDQDMLMKALIERRRQNQIENQLLHEYLERMMLNNQQQNTSSGSLLSPNPVSIGISVNSTNDRQEPSSPSHRCEACDISFWTQDLLSYHKITHCSGRQGQLARPLAFNFTGPNNFDSLASQQQQNYSQRTPNNHPPSVTSAFLNVLRPSVEPSSDQHQPCQNLSKSASPPRRRRTIQDERELIYNERIVENLVAQTNDLHYLLASGSAAEHLRLSILKQQLLGNETNGGINVALTNATCEPHNLSSQKSGLFAQAAAAAAAAAAVPNQQKQQQSMEMAPIAVAATTTSTVADSPTLLPFKKRKISEPDMRY